MTAVQQPSFGWSDVEQAVKQRIDHRTGGRIRKLEVKADDGRLVVHGHAASYHLKQLAIQGVFDVIEIAHPRKLEIDVQIVVNSPDLDSD